MKYCIDCDYYWHSVDTGSKWGVCRHPNNFKREIVSGKLELKDTFAYQTRNNPKKCGFSAKWFEPKVSKWTKIKRAFKRSK